MIVRENTSLKMEQMKSKLGLTGDIYVYNKFHIESLESHKVLFPQSIATTIEEAFEERVQYEAELVEKRRIETEQHTLEHPKEFENREE